MRKMTRNAWSVFPMSVLDTYDTLLYWDNCGDKIAAPRELAEVTGYGNSTVRAALTTLTKGRYIKKVGHGKYTAN